MEFVFLFLKRHFAEKPVVAPQGVGCFLQLHVTVNSCLADATITETPIIQTAAKSCVKISYRHLTKINSHYYGLSLMRTLTKGPYSVCYKESWLNCERCFCKWDVLQIITLLGIVVHFAGKNGELFGRLKCTEITNEKRGSNSYASSQSKSRSYCNVRSAVLLRHLSNKIMLLFSKLKSWLKSQQKRQTICKFLISSARGRKSKKIREASDVSNTWSSSIAGDKVHVSFVASSQLMHPNHPIMPSCKSNVCTHVHLILTLTNECS